MIEDIAIHVLACGRLSDRLYLAGLLGPLASLEMIVFLARRRRRDGRQEIPQ